MLLVVLLLVTLVLSLLHRRMLGALLNRCVGMGSFMHGLLGLLVKGIGRGRLHWQVAGVQGNPLERAEKLENLCSAPQNTLSLACLSEQ